MIVLLVLVALVVVGLLVARRFGLDPRYTGGYVVGIVISTLVMSSVAPRACDTGVVGRAVWVVCR